MRRIFRAAFVVAAFTVNNDANAQEKFSISVKGTPQFSFFQNRDDHDNNRIDRRATFNTSLVVGAAYNFT
ncbi:hypothetical protein A3860_34910 [Niastella vici]|uniref:Outer membrane protein beta-barrel domain-containing protein n=1 Tax=Niastella vici TaxID=1703345 RepID=A0A1V9FPC3_9BACT|nr:hypothetical protein [Niastella vici]OQP60121.1 hypothetical protein A3860_34910 [Niastella vici]